MKNLSIITMITMLVIASCKQAPESVEAKTGDAKEIAAAGSAFIYPIDLSKSSMEWIGTKLSTYHHGTVSIKDGELSLNNGILVAGSFSIDMPSIAAFDKGSEDLNSRLTDHLKSADFFDVTTFPEAIFVITSAKEFKGTIATSNESANEISEYKVSDPNYMIAGNLTIKGITKNIEFPARVNIGVDGVDATAKFSIDRKLWNIVYPGKPDDLIQDLIWFGISIKTNQSAQTAYK